MTNRQQDEERISPRSNPRPGFGCLIWFLSLAMVGFLLLPYRERCLGDDCWIEVDGELHRTYQIKALGVVLVESFMGPVDLRYGDGTEPFDLES